MTTTIIHCSVELATSLLMAGRLRKEHVCYACKRPFENEKWEDLTVGFLDEYEVRINPADTYTMKDDNDIALCEVEFNGKRYKLSVPYTGRWTEDKFKNLAVELIGRIKGLEMLCP